MANILKKEYQDLVDNTKFYLSRWRNDPVAFVMEACRAKEFGCPVPWQVDALYALRDHKKIARAAGHGVGKSRILGWMMWWVMATQREHPGANVKIPCTGPSGSNIEDVLWSEVNSVHSQMHPFLQEQFTILKDKAFLIGKEEEWFARLRTARKENPDALQGFHGDPSFFIIDEAPGVPDEVFELARGTMSGSHSFGVMFGNPRRLSGYFYEAFHARKSIWQCDHIDCADNLDTRTYEWDYWNADGQLEAVQVKGRVSPQYIESMRDEFGVESTVYRFRVRGQFPNSESNQLIKKEWLDAACERRDSFEEPAESKRVMGLDIAHEGDDWSALVIRKGRTVEHVEMWHGNDPIQSADRAESVYNDWLNSGKRIAAINVDDIGYGAGTCAALRKNRLPAYPVVVSKNAPEDGGTRCHRLRDWLWWQARLYFHHKSPKFSEVNGESWHRLFDELSSPLFGSNISSGKIEVEGKKAMKRRIKRSPDVADAFCLTFFNDWSMLNSSTSNPISRESELERYRRTRSRRSAKVSATRWKTV